MKTRALLLLSSAILASLLSGCVGIWGNRSHHEASSIVHFLYPNKDTPFVQPQIPTLRLPLRVGVAFVPSGLGDGRGGFRHVQANFTETQKTELLRKVAGQFRTLPFVQSIEIIPTTYLRPGGGFENLDQLRAMMGIDVIALIAYDQAQSSNENEASLAYWTIVGAYIVPAQRNSTHTMMEAVVYDISSRSLLFRAPGTSTIQNHSTLFRADYYLQEASAKGINDASAQMTANLAQELELFKVRAKEEPQNVRIEHKPGYTGMGDLGGAFVALLATLFIGGRVASRRAHRKTVAFGR
ncbi:MAG TPA: rhombotarget lipoprotein [Acidobacteriota bacterium]|nr:rhombotarget lipoprotein [Acidobacteriota bacterium]